jgi:NADH dehydrogenase FAD-containing subunit
MNRWRWGIYRRQNAIDSLTNHLRTKLFDLEANLHILQMVDNTLARYTETARETQNIIFHLKIIVERCSAEHYIVEYQFMS